MIRLHDIFSAHKRELSEPEQQRFDQSMEMVIKMFEEIMANLTKAADEKAAMKSALDAANAKIAELEATPAPVAVLPDGALSADQAAQLKAAADKLVQG